MAGPGVDMNRGLPAPEQGATDVSNPLLGVVLCCTSVPPEKRTKLAEQAQQMGAQHKYDLTSEVTHLIVGDYDTPKYKYVAKERPDVKVLTVDWVEAVRQLWMEDKAIDVDALEQNHRMPTFASLKICLTGFEDPTERASIADLVREHGAAYHGDLTKAVTHLIANRPEGSKYKHAKMWNLRIVSLEWITDSIERGMILDENLYNPEMPAEQRGKDAWNRQAVAKSPSGKRRYEAVPADEGRRKLRRTASTKLTSQNEKIWGDIVGSASVIQAVHSGVWETAEDLSKASSTNIPLVKKQPSVEAAGGAIGPITAIPRGTFSDCRFYIHGFDGKKFEVLRRYLTSHDAEISMTPEEFITPGSRQLFLLVPHSVPETQLPELPDCDTHIQTVTEWWVERCLDLKAFVDPSEYTFGRPFPKYPIPKFSDLIICSTGFEGTQLLHLAKAVRLLGATYDECFSKKSSVLICNPGRATRREKLTSAQEWKIPMVSQDWLLDSIESGTRQRYQQYLQRPKRPKLELGFAPVVDEDLVKREQPERVSPNPESAGSFSTNRSSKESYRASKSSKLDTTAFQPDQHSTIPTQLKYETSSDLTTITTTSDPLREISPNSPRKPFSEAPVIYQPIESGQDSLPRPDLEEEKDDEPTPQVSQQALSTAIISLLTKSKNPSEPGDILERRKRAPGRILGRAASIASNGGSGPSLSRASSVDSTASNGAAVIWPKGHIHNAQGPGNSIHPSVHETSSSELKRASSLTGLRSMTTGAEEDSQLPPPTQMRYDDVESSEYKARVVAKMTGENVVRKEIVRVATIASVRGAEGPGGADGMGRRTRLRERMGGKGTGLR